MISSQTTTCSYNCTSREIDEKSFETRNKVTQTKRKSQGVTTGPSCHQSFEKAQKSKQPEIPLDKHLIQRLHLLSKLCHVYIAVAVHGIVVRQSIVHEVSARRAEPPSQLYETLNFLLKGGECYRRTHFTPRRSDGRRCWLKTINDELSHGFAALSRITIFSVRRVVRVRSRQQEVHHIGLRGHHLRQRYAR